MFELGRSKYDKNRTVYLNRIIAGNLNLEIGDEVIFHPGDSPGEIKIRRLEKAPTYPLK